MNEGSAVSIFHGARDGTFANASDVATEVGVSAGAIALGDVNGDGTVDLVIADTISGSGISKMSKGYLWRCGIDRSHEPPW